MDARDPVLPRVCSACGSSKPAGTSPISARDPATASSGSSARAAGSCSSRSHRRSRAPSNTAADLAEELDRRAKIAALDAYLAEMDAELGPVPDAELQDAAAWVDGLMTSRPAVKRTGGRTRQARPA